MPWLQSPAVVIATGGLPELPFELHWYFIVLWKRVRGFPI